MTKKKIAIITSGHPPFDERIFWKFASSFANNGYNATILCSTKDICSEESGITINGFYNESLTKREKINKFVSLLSDYSPDIIICCEPLTILPAYLHKKHLNRSCKIISDITEWYPENVALKFRGIKKIASYIFLFILNIILTNLADALIIGETSKKKRYDFIAPFKKKIIIGYYPVLKYFNYFPPGYDGNIFTLCYAGLVNFSRGILTLVEIADLLKQKHPELEIRLKIVGRFESHSEELLFDELVSKSHKLIIEKLGWKKYHEISEVLKDADLCFDLREHNFIYNHSLPIKIFEYMAAGKPFIFSDVKPIRDELGEIAFGYLVTPDNKDDIFRKVESYLTSPALLLEHSQNGRSMIENGKSWENESQKLILFLNDLVS